MKKDHLVNKNTEKQVEDFNISQLYIHMQTF